jgi:hypothetical protein
MPLPDTDVHHAATVSLLTDWVRVTRAYGFAFGRGGAGALDQWTALVRVESDKTLSQLVATAAAQASERDGRDEDAILLYHAAKLPSVALDLLAKKLSQALFVDPTDVSMLMTQAQELLKFYRAPGNLRQSDALHMAPAVDRLELLLSLHAIYAAAQTARPMQAIDLAIEANLVPLDQHAVEAVAARWRSAGPSLSRHMPKLLSLVMASIKTLVQSFDRTRDPSRRQIFVATAAAIALLAGRSVHVPPEITAELTRTGTALA